MLIPRKILMAVVLCFSALLSSAQDSQPNRALKAYSNVFIEQDSRSIDLDPSDSIEYNLNFSDYQIGSLSFGFNLIQENGNIHEFEISRFSFDRIETDSLTTFEDPDITSTLRQGPDLNRVHIALRYEYLLCLNKSKPDAKWKAYLGAGVQPYARLLYYQTAETTIFPFSILDVGINFQAVPRVTYALSERWFLDVNIPISVIQAKYTREQNDNPVIPVDQRTQSSFDFETFPSLFQFRVGGGMRF